MRDTKNTVAGYFASGDDAHRAINELLDEGFKSSEIGAAFHSSASNQLPRPHAQVVNDTPIRTVEKSSPTMAGAASGTNAVTPSGLSTGGGSGTPGIGRPGPIPGSEIPSNLPTEIPSEIASDTESRPLTGSARGNFPATGGIHETHENTGWWKKLAHVFGSEDTDASTAVSDKSSLNYGTGEGHLGVYPDYDYPYSGPAFENSFSGIGIPHESARRLSRELRRGGAVVTVNAGSMNSTAEAVLERNHGTIRHESMPIGGEEAWDSGNSDARVEVFGEVHRVYPGHVSADSMRERKAS